MIPDMLFIFPQLYAYVPYVPMWFTLYFPHLHFQVPPYYNTRQA